MIRMHRFENWRRNKAWIQSRSSEADYLIGERSILVIGGYSSHQYLIGERSILRLLRLIKQYYVSRILWRDASGEGNRETSRKKGFSSPLVLQGSARARAEITTTAPLDQKATDSRRGDVDGIALVKGWRS